MEGMSEGYRGWRWGDRLMRGREELTHDPKAARPVSGDVNVSPPMEKPEPEKLTPPARLAEESTRRKPSHQLESNAEHHDGRATQSG